MNAIDPRLPNPAGNERVCAIGPTGSGKTELMRVLLARLPSVIIIDPKHQFTWGRLAIANPQRYGRMAHDLKTLVAQLHEIERANGTDPVIYRPPSLDLLPSNIARVDAVFEIALARRHTTVYVDEMSYLTGTASAFQEKIPNWFRAVTTGRSRGVGVWSAFQRPSNVPLLAMSESDVRISFFLRMKKDQQRAEELCGPIDWELLQRTPHSFVWATDQYSSDPVKLQFSHPAPLGAIA